MPEGPNSKIGHVRWGQNANKGSLGTKGQIGKSIKHPKHPFPLHLSLSLSPTFSQCWCTIRQSLLAVEPTLDSPASPLHVGDLPLAKNNPDRRPRTSKVQKISPTKHQNPSLILCCPAMTYAGELRVALLGELVPMVATNCPEYTPTAAANKTLVAHLLGLDPLSSGVALDRVHHSSTTHDEHFLSRPVEPPDVALNGNAQIDAAELPFSDSSPSGVQSRQFRRQSTLLDKYYKW